ncbi:MAG: hypothetical protein Q4G65_08190, partial [bacterium]|nr:hypothetical protein [bacterium]
MNNKKLILALIASCACVAFARPGGPGPGGHHGGPGPGPHHGPGPGFHHGPGPGHHGGHHRWGYGPGFHHGPGPGSLVGWRRGALHPYYRSCWYGDVWYDAYGYAYYYPGYAA